MKDWKSASNSIRQRSSKQIAESLTVEAPFTFNPVMTPSDTPAFLEANWESLGGAHHHIISMPGRDINLATDILITICKFWHVVESARVNHSRGALTWTVVDAYHACLLGARAVCALHGVLSYSLRGRSILIDFRPEFGRVDEMRTFNRNYRSIDDPIGILMPSSRQLEQKDSWGLLKRICDMVPSSDPYKAELSVIAGFAKLPLSQTRNTILYDSVAWVWRQDFRLASDNIIYENAIRKCDSVIDNTIEALDILFCISQRMALDLTSSIGLNLIDCSAMGGVAVGEAALAA